MDNHPINSLMEETMGKLREMIDVNTIVGAPITTPDGLTLIPVSKVSFGFASGGSDFNTKNQQADRKNPFGGGSGAGVKITPVAFVVVKDGYARIMTIESASSSTVERIMEKAPDLIDRLSVYLKKNGKGEDIGGAE